jgi:hypothetical protein
MKRDKRLTQLEKQRADAKAAALKFLDDNEGADGTLPDVHQEAYDALQGKIKQAEERVKLYQQRLELEENEPPIYDSDRDGPTRIEVKPPGFVQDPKKGFETHTEFLNGVIKSTRAGRIDDPRLRFLVADREGLQPEDLELVAATTNDYPLLGKIAYGFKMTNTTSGELYTISLDADGVEGVHCKTFR